MSEKKSEQQQKEEETLKYVDEILHPDYKTKFSSYKAMADYLNKGPLKGNETSESSLRRYILETDYVKIDNVFTISPMYYNGLEDNDSCFILHTDEKNDIIIMELFKLIFPFNSIEAIHKNYRYIQIYFNYDEFDKDDMKFLDSLRK